MNTSRTMRKRTKISQSRQRVMWMLQKENDDAKSIYQLPKKPIKQ